MRIVVISNTAFNIYNFRLGLINHLMSLGHKVVMVAPPDQYVSMMRKRTRADYIELKGLSRKGYNPFGDLMLCYELHRIFRKRRADLVISFTIKPNVYSAIAGYFSGTRSIVNMTGLGYVFLKDNMGNRIARTIYRLSLRLCDVVVFQNKTDKQLLESKKYFSPSKAVLINGSGINLEEFGGRLRVFRSKLFVFLFVGRMLKDKGVYELIHAAQSLWMERPMFELHLVGAIDEGNPSSFDQEQMKRWLHQNAFISYLGEHLDVVPAIQTSDVVVLPSYREGIPRVLLEAMALEKPFVTTRVPGCEDVTIEGVNGFLCDAQSVASLKAAMAKILDLNEEQRKAMGAAGKKLVEEKYDEKIIVKEYEKLLERITPKKGNPR